MSWTTSRRYGFLTQLRCCQLSCTWHEMCEPLRLSICATMRVLLLCKRVCTGPHLLTHPSLRVCVCVCAAVRQSDVAYEYFK